VIPRIVAGGIMLLVSSGLTVYAIRTGRALTRTGAVSRRDNPYGYWIVMGVNLALVAMALYILLSP
jgi:hypothetical protein